MIQRAFSCKCEILWNSLLFWFWPHISQACIKCGLNNWYILSVITQVRGQYKYLRYLWGVIVWKLRHSGQYCPVLPAGIVTVELCKYGSIKCKQTQKFFWKIYHTLLNSVFVFRLPKTWIHYSEDITGRWRDEDIAVSSFSLYYSWLNNIIGLVSTCIRFYILFLPI